MAGFKVEKQTASAVVLDDLGITIVGAIGTIYDLTKFEPNEIARSADLLAAIPAELLVVDTRDDTNATILSSADSTTAVERHNDSHFGVSGGRFGALDDPTVVLSDNFIVQYDLGSDSYESVDPATFIGDQTETIEDIVGAMGTNGTDTTFSYNDGAGTIQWDVDDVFLRNTGDTLDSGTLTIASGAVVSFVSGSTLTIADGATATIITPTGGFTAADGLVNKEYVDSVAAGLDPKESVRVATATGEDLTGGSFGGTYAAGGGPSGTGEFTGVDLSAGTGDPIDGLNYTGVSTTGLNLNDRVLVKNQADPLQNGIYYIRVATAADDITLTRATDQDGTPANEVSGGNFTFVEDTTDIFASSVNSGTGWVVLGDGILTLNTDDIDWTQFSGPGSVIAGIGLSRSGNTIDLDVDDLTSATAALTDTLPFHDADGAAEASGSQTKKSTFSSLYNAHDVVYGVTANGIIARTADDTYASRTIMVEGAGALDGLAISDGDGVAGDPTIGLDILNLPVRSDAIDPTDRVPVYNVTSGANEYYPVSEIAGAASSNSFETWAAAGNTTGDASIVADSSTDTATITGGIGINIDFTAATDTVVYDFARVGMADTAITTADSIPFFDATNSNEAEYRTVSSLITDLGIQTDTNTFYWGSINTTGNTAGDTTPAADPDAADDTLTIDGGIGITITGTAASDTLSFAFSRAGMADTAVTDSDTISFFDATNSNEPEYRSFGDIKTDLNIPRVATINGQPIVVYDDTTRTKTLSVESNAFMWANNTLDNNEWMDIGDGSNTDLGYIMPLDGTIVMATGHTEDANSNTFSFDVFIDAANNGSIGTLSGGGEAEFATTTLSLDFTAGQKLRIQADRTAGSSELGDVDIVVFVRWRS